MNIPSSISETDFCIQQPFLLFEMENFLHPDRFDALDRTFPSLDDHFAVHGADYGAKKYLDNRNPSFANLLERLPEWKALYRDLTRRDTLRKLSDFVESTGRPAKWSYLGGFRKTKVRLGFEFSILTHGDTITPHCDVPAKLLSLMLYFPTKGQDDLGTEFYRARKWHETQKVWDSKILDSEKSSKFFDQHSTFYQSAFTPNKLVGFIKSDCSWHGLQRVSGNAPRRSIVVNIFEA